MGEMERDGMSGMTLRRPALALGVVIVVGFLAGLLGSAFGPHYPVLIAATTAVIGILVRRHRPVWGLLLVALGIAMGAGALLYVVLGLLQQGSPGSGSGSGIG